MPRSPPTGVSDTAALAEAAKPMARIAPKMIFSVIWSLRLNETLERFCRDERSLIITRRFERKAGCGCPPWSLFNNATLSLRR
jgi:hypothetical protein